MVGGDILVLFGILLLLTAVGLVVRRSMLHRMRALPAPAHMPAPLAPTELAYLLRDGDMGHTLIVLSVDLIHRAVKSAGTGAPPELRPYETQAWVSVKDFLGQWAQQKVGHLVPVTNIKDPVQWVVRLNTLKRFFGETLRSFVVDMLKDPRQIRRYFSITGVARLAVQMYASGVRLAVERELRSGLLQAGLLVPEARRKKFAGGVVLMIPVVVACAFLANSAVGALPIVPFAIFVAMGIFNAAVLRTVQWLPGFVPTYEEFAKVSAELKRGGTRVALVRAVLRTAKFVLIAVVIFLSLLLLGIELLVSANALQIAPATALTMLLATSALGFLVARLAQDWHGLTLHEQPTLIAEQQIREAHTTLSHVSPLQSFSRLCGDDKYDPTFSQLVAYYGIETLWLLS